MLFQEFLTCERVCLDTTAQSKTAVLFKVSQLLCQNQPELDVEQIFDAYWRRDSLGSSAIGHGIIVPHIRTPELSSIKGCFLRLKHPVEFGAEDKQPIDLVFGLIVPQSQPEEHLNTLKEITRFFNQSEFREACRQAECDKNLFDLLIESSTLEFI